MIMIKLVALYVVSLCYKHYLLIQLQVAHIYVQILFPPSPCNRAESGNERPSILCEGCSLVPNVQPGGVEDEQTEEAAVLQVLEGGYSSYVVGNLWSFVSAGRSTDTGLAATLDVN